MGAEQQSKESKHDQWKSHPFPSRRRNQESLGKSLLSAEVTMRFAFQVARIRADLIAALLSCAATCFSFGATPTLTVDLGQSAGPVSPRMYGLMTEEINHSYDGGLYGELVQNRALLDDANAPSHYAAVQSGSSAAA